MKAIDLAAHAPTLADVLALAEEENVILRTCEGRQFVLAEIDDFADEVARVTQNKGLMQLLHERSAEKPRFTLAEARAELRGKKKPQRKRSTK
jgi:hypothetical protein